MPGQRKNAKGRKSCKCNKQIIAMGRVKYAEHLNNYNSLKDAITHQYVNRPTPLAQKPKLKLQIT